MKNPSDYIFVAKHDKTTRYKTNIVFRFTSSDDSSALASIINAGYHSSYFSISVGTSAILIYNLISNSTTEITFDENGDYVSSVKATNIDTFNVIEKLNSASSSAAYAPSADTDFATKAYVDLLVPTEEELLTMLAETDFISPATTASGDIYTNADGDIYNI